MAYHVTVLFPSSDMFKVGIDDEEKVLTATTFSQTPYNVNEHYNHHPTSRWRKVN